jgi:hypothetical protein
MNHFFSVLDNSLPVIFFLVDSREQKKFEKGFIQIVGSSG